MCDGVIISNGNTELGKRLKEHFTSLHLLTNQFAIYTIIKQIWSYGLCVGPCSCYCFKTLSAAKPDYITSNDRMRFIGNGLEGRGCGFIYYPTLAKKD